MLYSAVWLVSARLGSRPILRSSRSLSTHKGTYDDFNGDARRGQMPTFGYTEIVSFGEVEELDERGCGDLDRLGFYPEWFANLPVIVPRQFAAPQLHSNALAKWSSVA